MRTRGMLLMLCAVALAAGAAQPQWSREWKTYAITHTHADIGYTDLIPEVERVWCQGMDQAIAATEKGLKWTLEGSLLFDVYRRHRKPDKVAELVRATFYANAGLRREFGIESPTAMLSDITGITWGLPRALAGGGTRYLLFGPGRYKELLGESALPHLCYLKSQDGSRVLMQLRTGKYRDYTSARMFLNAAAMEKDVPELLKYYEGMGDKYPYDAILLQVAFDNINPQVALAENIRLWNTRHSNPRVYMATPTEFFRYIEGKYGPKIPEASGDITSAWTDDPGIYAQATGMKRQAASEALSAEKFAVIDQLAGSDRPYPKEAIEQVYRDLLIYTDHTYGMDNWNWEHAPLAQSLGRLFSPIWDYYKESWEDKKEYAYEAARISDGLLGNALESLASKIPSEGRTMVVCNPLSWPRTDVVRLLHRGLKVARGAYEILDNVSGERVPYQPLAGDRGGDRRYDTVVFVAQDVPALGYKTYRVVPVSAPPQFAETSVTLRGNVLENEFYRVEVEPETGGVSSILDKELNRELVERGGAEKVNQYLYYSLTGEHEPIYQDKHPTTHLGRVWTKEYKIGVYTPLAARIEPGQDGPAMKSLRAGIRMEHGPAPTELTQEVILHPGVKRIDFVNRLHKAPTLTKEEVYSAFPFDVKNFEIHRELPGAVFRPYKDQLSGSFTGFSGIQHWADASNGEYGVAVATRQVPAIEFGEIRTNEWSMEYKPARSAFYF